MSCFETVGVWGSIAKLEKDQCFVHSGNKDIIVPKFVNPFPLEFVLYFEVTFYNVTNFFRYFGSNIFGGPVVQQSCSSLLIN